MKKRMKKWYLAIMAVLGLVISILVQILIYIIKGQFDFSTLLGALAGTVILIIINVVLVYIIKVNTP